MLIAHDCASYTICNKQRPSYKTSFPQNGKCSQEGKELSNSLESPLHLGEYHVVTLQKRCHQGGGQQHFQTVRALQSGAEFKLGQEVKYNTSRIPVSNFNMAGYYLKPAATSQRRQSVEDWCQSVPVPCQSWSPTSSLQGGNISLQGGNIYAEVSNHDYEDDSGFTEGFSDVASEREEGLVANLVCPDNATFSPNGMLWIATDGSPRVANVNDGLYAVATEGAE